MQVSTTCPYCGVGCGLTVSQTVHEGTPPLVLASDKHPANFGRVCSKGSSLSDTLDPATTPRRLLKPSVRGKECSWDHASTEIARRIQTSIDKYGPDSVAFYLSGQLLTEDYYVANKLAKGFLGTANVDTNSRLCMSSAVAAYKRAFGSDTVPCCYEDLELSDLVVLIGSNAAWTHPVLYQRLVAAKEHNPKLKVVLIDPRKTATADLADLHLPITPSSDNYLFQGLLNFLHQNQFCDLDYISQHTEGFEQVIEQASAFDLDAVASICGLERQDLERFYRWFADTPRAISFYSQGINQSSSGTDKCNAIINCHLATAKIGREGAGPFSITGQPNAMGGREVGGLANTLAAHMEFTPEHIDTVRRFWQASNMATEPGLKAIDLFESLERGHIKVLWIMATNPAVSLPNSKQVQAALAKCETVIVSDVTHTDTSAYADILLPAEAWSEKDGTVTNSERRISRQRRFASAAGESKPDWWAISQVAAKLGYQQAFDYQNPSQIFAEHCALSGFENDAEKSGMRDFDISGLLDDTENSITQERYDSLEPIQWPVTEDKPNGTARMFTDGKFFTASGKAQFVGSKPGLAKAFQSLCAKESAAAAPLLLNTGRIRDQWHTMTRTGYATKLNAHTDVASVQVHPVDALDRGLKHNSMARVFNTQGEALLQVKVSNSVKRGELFAPIHWNRQFANKAVVNMLASSVVDPVSGQPEFKASAVTVTPMLVKAWARVISRKPIKPSSDCVYWSTSRVEQGYVSLLAFNADVDWRQQMAVATNQAKGDVVEYHNSIRSTHSLVFGCDGDLHGMVFQAQCASDIPGRAWLVNAFASNDINAAAKKLRGEQGARDELVCACFGTTRKHLEQAILDGAQSQCDLAERLGCGSKCGSCKPELNQYIKVGVKEAST